MILSARVATVSGTRIHCGSNALQGFRKLLLSHEYRKSRVFILVDANTGKHCLPLLVEACPELDAALVFEIEGGEASKSLSSAEKIWIELLASGADRRSLLVNLGGGVVSDLGGFIAAGLKRGIPYINIPTSLTGMVDAAIGGKTGVNMGELKNQLGFFYSPLAVFVDARFLKTLPSDHIRSGFAEIVKSALIGDPVLWRKLLRKGAENILALDILEKPWQDLIMKTMTFKNRITCQDFREQKLRKILNFGHTIGHALESFVLARDEKGLLHGDAVALGMIAETWLSHLKAGLSGEEAMEIISFLKAGYKIQAETLGDLVQKTPSSYDNIYTLLLYDKKNSEGQVRYTLIQAAGKPRINRQAGRDETAASLDKIFD
ncbi:MAG: 3-dehydroquinate synthase family protein [Bacteroidota bacterium]